MRLAIIDLLIVGLIAGLWMTVLTFALSDNIPKRGVKCIEGYKFVLDKNGDARQVLDEQGLGLRC
jgi:hypothetical protein